MPTSATGLKRGEVWGVDFDPTSGREQAGFRPALIVSADAMNNGASELVIVCPITGTNRRIPTHVPVDPPEAGLTKPSVVLAEQIRTVSTARLGRRYGEVSPVTMAQVDRILGFVLDI